MTEAPARVRRWTADHVPPQDGRTALITGANSGIGFEAAAVLAQRGAEVVLACRNPEKAAQARDRILATSPEANVRILELDLTSLASVQQASEEVRTDLPALDLLINNAGVMWTPYQRTADGFELQFGTNHLGHFALTGLLLDRLLTTPGSRVVTISSIMHWSGRIDFTDLHGERRYRRRPAYGQSKLANLLFSHELQRRLARAGAQTVAVAAHPGAATSELTRTLPPAMRSMQGLVMQSAAMGALGALRAATDPDVQGGDYFGPRGLVWGHPHRAGSSRRARDVAAGQRLWQESERLTGITYQL